ncbi:efflux RND transporter periplasmic adaptor subunit [Rubrivivax gelatinosus]|uniref:RND family efflux transporter MFP subunit n=1 Tax=Rubrivivax gelatinosus TaxID=28068 RepID=A0A4R2MBZ5_RUBGE|nr:efflux RND transporter periplasmic adaptor subunit [Rubrivivax gelatinosus]MBK1685916.1 efflux transporter periplasmic adaptor subunit [Rubrivivax gelatinosus]TCP04060.1 RND family efflux transporter MFP subunit [Rubrivivax gelatinosus]
MLRRKLAPLVLCLSLVLTACGRDDHRSDPRTEAPLVRVSAVQGAGSASRSFTGVVAARVQSDLGFRVPGKLLERLVDTGQSVKRGQPLMRIDPIDLGLQARAQQEVVAAALARARQTAEDEARYRDLVAEGAVSASAYDQIKAAAEAARAQLKAAEAQAEVARNASSYALLLADADGVVVETLAEPGQVVSAGQPVVRLARAGQREAVVHLPETLRPAVGSVARATLYGPRSEPVSARLRVLSDAADRVTRTYEARYVLEGALAKAPLGATVTVEIPAGASSAPAVQVPIGAVFDPGKGPGVWVVEGEPAKVAWRAVQVLDLSDELARVAGNLKVGDRVVSLGAHLLQDGQAVRPAGKAQAAPAGERR